MYKNTKKENRAILVILLFTPVFTAIAQTKLPILSNITKRSEWSGPAAGNKLQIQEQQLEDIRYLTIHNFGCPKDQELTRMKSNHDAHVKKQYGYLAYHYVVGDSGTVYQARRPTLAPASATYYLNDYQLKTEVKSIKKGQVYLNENFEKWTKNKIPGNTVGHITVSLMCGGRIIDGKNREHAELLNDKAMDVVVELVAELLVRHDKLSPASIRAHREMADTSCPNDEIYKWLRGDQMNKTSEGVGLKKIRKRYKEIMAANKAR